MEGLRSLQMVLDLLGGLDAFRGLCARFGGRWGALGTPFGTLLELIFGSGPALETFGEHLLEIVAPLGRLSVSTSIWDAENHPKSSLPGAVDVFET